MAKTVPIDVRVSDVEPVRVLVSAAITVLRDVEECGQLESHSAAVADLRRALGSLTESPEQPASKVGPVPRHGWWRTR